MVALPPLSDPEIPEIPLSDLFKYHNLLHCSYIGTNLWFRVVSQRVDRQSWYLRSVVQLNSPNMGDIIRFNPLENGKRTLAYYKLKVKGKKFLLPEKLSDDIVFDNQPLTQNGKITDKTEFLEGTWANIEITDTDLVHNVGGFYHCLGSSSRLYSDA